MFRVVVEAHLLVVVGALCLEVVVGAEYLMHLEAGVEEVALTGVLTLVVTVEAAAHLLAPSLARPMRN
jgi:hypothetical protein